MRLRTAMFCVAAIGVALSMAAPASAQTAQDRRKACSEEWNAAKEAGKVPSGQTWSEFYSECNTRLKAAEEAKETKSTDKKSTEKPSTEKKATEKKAAEPKAAATPEESTRQSRMKQCSEEWNAAKAAGKVSEGQTWPKFYSECNARLSGAAPAVAPAAAATTAAKPAATAAKPAAAPAAEESTRQSRMKQCSEEWNMAKAAGKIPEGQTWPKFYSDCNARLSGAAPAAAPAAAVAKPAAAPVKPAAAPAQPASAKVEDDEDTGEGVREPTPGQLAARQRMKDCGAEWRTAKDANRIPEGQTWPQYWSACNKRLKAAGR